MALLLLWVCWFCTSERSIRILIYWEPSEILIPGYKCELMGKALRLFYALVSFYIICHQIIKIFFLSFLPFHGITLKLHNCYTFFLFCIFFLMTFMSFIEMETIWEIKLNFVMMNSSWSNALHTSADVLSCLTDFSYLDLLSSLWLQSQ